MINLPSDIITAHVLAYTNPHAVVCWVLHSVAMRVLDGPARDHMKKK